ncbi:MAG: HAD family hydrolase [Candidatus Omnitrophica bacterium]|nr:HAD family hydrolase [Candidatus Omnitrophota bacterium]
MRTKRGAVFLDRDGVINVCPTRRYITRWKEFRFLPGVLKGLRILALHGRTVIVVSNQAGVGRGYFRRSELELITRRMLERIRRTGGKIRAVYYCTHRFDAGCPCRKPKIQLLKKAAGKFSIDLTRSFVVGDHETDILMGRSAGCRTIHVLSGRQSRKDVRQWAVHPDRIAKDLAEAIRWILKQR